MEMGEGRLAPRVETSIVMRSLAFVIDIALLRGLLFTLLLPALGQVGARTALMEAVATVAVTGFYFVGLWTWTGQTVGKKIFRLRVIQADGYPLGLGHALLRYATYVAMVLPFFMGFIFSAFFLINGPSRQGLHDKAAGTLVVRIR